MKTTPLYWSAVDLSCACDLNMRDCEEAYNVLDDEEWEVFCQKHKARADRAAARPMKTAAELGLSEEEFAAQVALSNEVIDEVIRADEHAAALRDAVSRSDWGAVIDLTCGRRMTDLWSAAMTAQYGTVGLHESRLGADGRPTAETLATFPELARAMRDAEERCRRLVAWVEKRT